MWQSHAQWSTTWTDGNQLYRQRGCALWTMPFLFCLVPLSYLLSNAWTRDHWWVGHLSRNYLLDTRIPSQEAPLQPARNCLQSPASPIKTLQQLLHSGIDPTIRWGPCSLIPEETVRFNWGTSEHQSGQPSQMHFFIFSGLLKASLIKIPCHSALLLASGIWYNSQVSWVCCTLQPCVSSVIISIKVAFEEFWKMWNITCVSMSYLPKFSFKKSKINYDKIIHHYRQG